MLAAILMCGAVMVTSCQEFFDAVFGIEDKPVTVVPDTEEYDMNKEITDGNYDKSLAVKCINGTFVGAKMDNVIYYLGIPFVGQQPVGSLRWKAPVDYIADDRVYEAYTYGKTPMQAEGDPAALYYQGEDCLYLNVWKTDDTSMEKKPVMVWIYGGGFETGGTIDPQYDCYNLLRENPDVIIVTIAYRLAAYGFMHLSHLPDGKDYPDAQNLGTLDQLMGLKWVHENIAAFGGDPRQCDHFRRVCRWFELCTAATGQRLPEVFQARHRTKRLPHHDEVYGGSHRCHRQGYGGSRL